MNRNIIAVLVIAVVVVVAAVALLPGNKTGTGDTTQSRWHIGDFIEWTWYQAPVNSTSGGDMYSIMRYVLVDVGSEYITLNFTQLDAARDVVYSSEYVVLANSTTFLSRTSVSLGGSGVNVTDMGAEVISMPQRTVTAEHYVWSYLIVDEMFHADIWEANGVFVKMVGYGNEYTVLVETTDTNIQF